MHIFINIVQQTVLKFNAFLHYLLHKQDKTCSSLSISRIWKDRKAGARINDYIQLLTLNACCFFRKQPAIDMNFTNGGLLYRTRLYERMRTPTNYLPPMSLDRNTSGVCRDAYLRLNVGMLFLVQRY